MLRVWIVSGLVVALVVTAILYFTGDPAPGDTGPAARRPPSKALTEAEVRRYLEIWPGINAILQKVAEQYIRQRTKEYEPKIDASGYVSDYLFQHNMTMADWDRLKDRVEYVVFAIRYRENRGEVDAGIRERIRQKETLLKAATGEMRKKLEADLEEERAKLEREPPPAHPEDLELVRSFWADLDPLVPEHGAPRRKQ